MALFSGTRVGLFALSELAEMAGGAFVSRNLVPRSRTMVVAALGLLRTSTQKDWCRGLPDWHYDKVHECFRAGHAAMVGDWPGYYSLYRDARISLVHDRLGLSPYPLGRQGIARLWRRPHVCADAAGSKEARGVAVVASSDRRGTATV